MSAAHRPLVALSVGLVGVGSIAVTPVRAPLPRVRVPAIQLTTAEDATDIVIDILRHGQRLPPQNLETTPSPDYPGPPLSDLGQ